jgi:hypothetical protein
MHVSENPSLDDTFHVPEGLTQLSYKVKGKVKLSLCFSITEHHVMNVYWESGCIAPRILHLCTRWRCAGSFTPRERAPGAYWIGSWVGPRAVLDAVVKRKLPASYGNRTLEL